MRSLEAEVYYSGWSRKSYAIYMIFNCLMLIKFFMIINMFSHKLALLNNLFIGILSSFIQLYI